MIVAVDTGGTKTLVTIFSRDGVAGEQIKFQTPKDTNDYITTLKETLQSNYGGQRIEAIVIAMPGIIKNGVAKWCENLKWSDFDVAKELKGVLGPTPIFVENDANLGALAETRSRNPMPQNSLYVTVSTGIGTGFVTDGSINEGVRLSEGGRMIIEYGGKMQEWELFASGKAIYETFGTYAKDITSKETWDDIADRISRGLLLITPVLQPDVIIIGGSIGTYFDRYKQSLTKILRDNLPHHIPSPKLVQAQHPEQAVIYGCYYYAIDQLTH
jgi:predicted NBD/HSP70 family sugar kinase